MPERDDKLYSLDEATAKQILRLTLPAEDYQFAKIFTDLTEEEINYLTILSVINERLKLDVCKDFVWEFCKFRISRNRLGRKEVVWIASSIEFVMRGGRGKLTAKDLFAGW